MGSGAGFFCQTLLICRKIYCHKKIDRRYVCFIITKSGGQPESCSPGFCVGNMRMYAVFTLNEDF